VCVAAPTQCPQKIYFNGTKGNYNIFQLLLSKEIYKRNKKKYYSVGRLWKELLMYELYGPLINLGALSRCPIRFSWASVWLCSSGSHKFEIYVHLSFGFRSFFPIYQFSVLVKRTCHKAKFFLRLLIKCDCIIASFSCPSSCSQSRLK